jgi:site-specific recombinase XerD
MLEELQRRNYSPATTRGYILTVKQFAEYFGKSPEPLGAEEVRRFQLYLLNDKKLAPGTVEMRMSALRLLYKKTLKRRDLTFDDLVFPKIPRKLPVVMSPEEVTRRIESAPNLMHRTILMVLYGTGIRRTEAARLKVSDIDAARRLPHRNLAMELQKLLNDEVRSRSRKNLVLSRSFAERLEETIRRYQSRTIGSA